LPARTGASAWRHGLEAVFPKARFFHKSGVISSYALEVACVDDRAQGGPRFILVPVVEAGSESKPEDGESLVGRMSVVIGEWVKTR